MKNFTLDNMPPASTLLHYIDTSRKRQIIDGWLKAALAWVHCARVSKMVARAISILSKSVRETENFNRNLQINAHILASKDGRAWARGVLGEANIKRWRAKYDACCKAGFMPDKKKKAKAKAKPDRRTFPNAYTWKPIALPSIAYWFFTPLNTTFPDLPNPFAKQIFTWPRPKRGFTPAVFWPYELEDDYEVDPRRIYKDVQVSCAETPKPAPELALTLKPNNVPVLGARGESSRNEAGKHNAPGSSAASTDPECNALDPGSSPGTDGKDDGGDKPP